LVVVEAVSVVGGQEDLVSVVDTVGVGVGELEEAGGRVGAGLRGRAGPVAEAVERPFLRDGRGPGFERVAGGVELPA